MKTILVTTAFLDDDVYFQKTLKWINYYLPLSEKLGFSDILILDNASSREKNNALMEAINNNSRVKIARFDSHMKREGMYGYEYLWRAVWYLDNLLHTYDKVIYMDNDFYLLSDRIMEYVKNLNSGWTTFWCPKYCFPETGCHILTKCPEYEKFTSKPYDEHVGSCMERVLPTTHREKRFMGDRWSEYPSRKVPAEADFSAQTLL